MRLAAFVAFFTALALPALAQDARIRSGEHETFARLVVYLPQAAEYEVESDDDSFAIDFGGDFGFETTDVFYYIPRTRIADLSAGAGRLELDLACECEVTVERLSDSVVFLDVNDAGSVEPQQTVVADLPEKPAPAAASGPLNPAIRLPAVSLQAAATLLPGGLELAEGVRPAEQTPEPGQETPSEPVDETLAIASNTSRAVAEQIARATAQGLLEAEPVDIPSPAPAHESKRERPAEPDPAAPPARVAGTKAHISIRSSVDEALGHRLSPALSDRGMTGSCLPGETFEAAAWLPEPQIGLARIRRQVIAEFDKADPEGVAALARAYIAMTFGAEARHAIQSFKVTVPDADILLAMADIVDEGVARVPGRLVTQYDCPGAGALWAALAAPEIPDAAELDTDAVALAFSALPPHMRTRLGPILAERLIDYGAVETASVVRTAIMRAPGAPNVETALLDASLAIETGREAEADEKLAEVVEETSGRNVQAVERLIERRIEAGEPVEDEVLASADALIYEHRGTPLAHRLSELRIEGLATSGKARQALAFLAETERHLPQETADRLRGVVYSEAARLLDDAPFLLVAVTASEQLGISPEEMAARRALARRLNEMELYSVADSLGVDEGRMASPAAPAAPGMDGLSLREPLPERTATLERTAALLEHSAALRQRLAAALGEVEAQ